MVDAPTPQGWYPAPDNPAMVRFWDGEVWTDRTRPSPHAATAAGSLGGPDHGVQHSPLVAAELRDGETIKRGYRSRNTNTSRLTFIVATESRFFSIQCKLFRGSQVKSVESIDYTDIDTVGMVSHYHGAITSGTRLITIPMYGGGAPDMVAWIRSQIDTDEDVVDLRTLPKPKTRTAVTNTPAAVSGVGVADEIRKLDALRDEGLLTDDEFEAQKQLLLGQR